MSQYSSGEIAKLCGVSVRTVQYYDSRNILVPSALSEGGRRLYSEDDLKKMRIICYLREMGFSLDNIGELFSQEHPENVISLLIAQQEQELRKQMQESQEKLSKLAGLKRGVREAENFSIETLGDIAQKMKNQKKRRRTLLLMLAVGAVMDLIQIAAIVYGVKTGNWWPLVIGLPFVLGLGIYISWYYYTHSDYICPQCHKQFHPKFRAAFFASHTTNTRNLTCPHCGNKSFCVETYAETKP